MNFIPRQYLYVFIVCIMISFLLLWFSIGYVIPSGKEYRQQHLAMNTVSRRVHKLSLMKSDAQSEYDNFSKKHQQVLTSFAKPFDIDRFVEINKHYFQKITLTKLKKDKKSGIFDTYRVDAVSKIDSPENFYKFLQQADHEGWIIKIEFPIHFQRDHNLIDLDFTMRVYRRLETNSSSTVLKQS